MTMTVPMSVSSPTIIVMILTLPQLVNQIGKKLEQINLLGDLQKTDVLTWARLGGFIRWHEFVDSQGVFTSWRGCYSCHRCFSFRVEFEVSGAAHVLLVVSH